MWWLLILIALALFWAMDYYLDKRKWRTWPTLDEYLARHPAMRTTGVACEKCGGKNISSHQALKQAAEFRLHRCDTCSTWLYRNDA